MFLELEIGIQFKANIILELIYLFVCHSFASAMIYGLIQNKSLYDSALIGLKAAKLSLLSTETIPKNIGRDISKQP